MIRYSTFHTLIHSLLISCRQKRICIQWRRVYHHVVDAISFFFFVLSAFHFFFLLSFFFCFIWLFCSGVNSIASVTLGKKRLDDERRRRRKRIFSIFCSFAFGTALSLLCLGRERSDKNDKKEKKKNRRKIETSQCAREREWERAQ